MSNEVQVGDTAVYRGSWGDAPPKAVRVESLTVTCHPGCKEGYEVDTAPSSLLLENRLIFGLSDGHWCYADQIDTLVHVDDHDPAARPRIRRPSPGAPSVRPGRAPGSDGRLRWGFNSDGAF